MLECVEPGLTLAEFQSLGLIAVAQPALCLKVGRKKPSDSTLALSSVSRPASPGQPDCRGSAFKPEASVIAISAMSLRPKATLGTEAVYAHRAASTSREARLMQVLFLPVSAFGLA